jgi:hypothetical protein
MGKILPKANSWSIAVDGDEFIPGFVTAIDYYP